MLLHCRGHVCPSRTASKGEQRYTPVLRPLAISFLHAQPTQRRASRLGCHQHRLKGCWQRGTIVCGAAPFVSTPARQIPSKGVLYRQLAEAAKAGNYEAAENCVEAIKEAGFELTAQTYHGLIISYAKAGITEAAVRNFYLSLEQGVQPLPQTYAVVIHSCLQNYETSIVEEIYDNLLSASVDRMPGWETYLRGLASLGNRTTYIEPEIEAEPEKEADPVWDTQAEAKQGNPKQALAAQSRDEDEDDDELEDEDSEEDDDEDIADLPSSGADLQEPAEAGLEGDDSAPELPLDFEEGQEGPEADELSTAVEAEVNSGTEGSEDALPAEVLDQYEFILVHDQPLDVDELGSSNILDDLEDEAQALVQSEAAEETSSQERGTQLVKMIEVEPLEHLQDAFQEGEGSEAAVDEEERKAIQERFAAIERELAPPPKPAVAYHPGQPNGKVQLMAKISETMEYGRQEGWYTDLDTYEDILKLLCEDPQTAVLAQAILNSDLLDRPGVLPETRHFNCILRAEAIYRGVRHARKTIDDMIEGRYGLDILPDIESMNAMLEGCVIERLTGKAYAIEDFQEVIAGIITGGMKMNKRTHALQLMVYLQEADLDKVLWELGEMESLAAPRMALEELSDYWLNELIVFLMDCKCVLEVLRLMTVMRDDNRGLPYALREPNENGQMFYTEWLPLFFQSCHASRLNEGLEKYRAGRSFLEYRGVSLDSDSFEAVNPTTGRPLRVYDMDEWQVLAELEVRDIPTTGNADDRAFRLQRARNAEPMKVTEFNEALRGELSAKQSKKMQREADKESSKNFWVELRSLELVNHKQGKNLYTKTFLEEAKQGEDRADRAFFEELDAPELSPEITLLLKQYREASNSKDLERQYMLETRIFDTEEPGFMAVNPHFHGRTGYGFKRTWPDFCRGTRLAFLLMELAIGMDGAPGFLDYIRLLEGFIVEKDAEGCFQLLLKLHPQATALEEEEARLFYSKALTLCLECREVQYVHDIGVLMEELGLQPMGALDHPDVLPALRQAAEYVETMPDYEREVGRDLGEALGGAETYRMADLEGKGEDHPAGPGEIYRKPQQIGDVLNRVEMLPEGREALGEEEESSLDSSSGAEDEEEEDWQPSDNGTGRGQRMLADPDVGDMDGEDPDFDSDWENDNEA